MKKIVRNCENEKEGNGFREGHEGHGKDVNKI
jgi:hypothetical protein